MCKAFMKKIPLSSEKIIPILFLFFCLHLGYAAFPTFLHNLSDAMAQKDSFSEFVEVIDEQYYSMLTTKKDQPFLNNKGTYINLNGLIANLLDQKVVNSRIKLDNGHLSSFGRSFNSKQVEAISENLYAFYNAQNEKGKNFLFVLTPSQTCGQDEFLPLGYSDNANKNGDLLMQLLQEKGVPILDLRKEMRQQNISCTDAFFITDHHWTPQTAFWAYTEIMAKLYAIGSIDEIDPLITDPDNFDFEIYEKCFLGSSGKRTGQYFAGVDDFCVIVPKFDTNISVTITKRNVQKTGRYEDVSYNLSHENFVQQLQNPDYFNHDPYAAYGYGNNDITNWRNASASQDKKFLLIGDSMANIPFSLLPIGISSCDELDMRHYSGDFTAYYNEYDPDTVIIMANVGSILSTDSDNITYQFIK